MKTRTLLLSLIAYTTAFFAHAAAPVVNLNSVPVQRPGTKLVDINYTLTLDAGQTAFVEMWFSPDGGLNFPVRCVDVTGDIDANVTSGSKTATWNAESDWNHQITNQGRIRVIATYGDHPSGYNGSGSGGNTGGSGSGHSDPSMKTVFMDVLWMWDYDDNDMTEKWMDRTNWFHQGGINSQIRVDPIEVTNEKWNEVTQWALGNNYTGLPLAPDSNASPRTNVTFWEVIKWCNARSEKDGLKPAYYIDGDEATQDVNGNGIVDTGVDIFSPYDPGQDTNMNGLWDPGESFTDNNFNGTFEPKEYQDANNNGQYDKNLVNPFRQGMSITLSQSLWSHVDRNASGYRLPDYPIILKLATGGNSQKKWPWGDESPDTYAQFTTEYAVPQVNSWGDNMYGSLPGPSEATRPANGYDIKDLIGNVGEYTEEAYDMSGGAMGTPDIRTQVFGGSYLGLKKIHPTPNSMTNGYSDNSLNINRYSDLMNDAPVTTGSPAVGFRCFVNSN